MKILITGITGSLGTQVTKDLLSRPENIEIIGYSRDELRQKNFIKDDRLTMVLGCVRDKARIVEASRDVDMIFHFAALKHVDLLESNPDESIKTNILGTENVLHAQRVNKIARVVLSSTDKAVEPINVYGASKFIAERIVMRNRNNVVCRWGNVIASNGSVVPIFVKSLKKDSTVSITDVNMTRFWIHLEEASKFFLERAFGDRGGLFIPPMKAAKVLHVAACIASLLGNESVEAVQIGLRPGEKINECIRTEFEGGYLFSHTAPRFEETELRELLKPVVGALA